MAPFSAAPRVLVAPLDWGLGHATRCIPIIRQLLQQGCTVLLAAEGKTAALLQAEFPQLRLLHLAGYRISYSSSAWGLSLKIVAQIPKLLSIIKYEQAWLQKVVAAERIDAVISDNRYGFYHRLVPCIFLTHQLRIKAPLKPLETLLQKINYHFINRFTACWVPDAAGQENFAGTLSHPRHLPRVPLRYLGVLSRFSETKESTAKHLLILLSGPEPQRSLFEALLLAEIKNYTSPVVLVRGLPGETSLPLLPPNVTVHNHLPAAQLNEVLQDASLVIARCGYSTVMDLAVLKKRSILIPTPGQTEQEYLATHLMKNRFAFCVPQKKFRLKQALALAETFPYRFQQTPVALQAAVQDLIAMLQAKISV